MLGGRSRVVIGLTSGWHKVGLGLVQAWLGRFAGGTWTYSK